MIILTKGRMVLPSQKREITMNNKAKFIKAHSIARSTVTEVGDYQIAFKLALTELNKQPSKVSAKVSARVSNVVRNMLTASAKIVMIALICSIIVGLGYSMTETNNTVVQYFGAGFVVSGVFVTVMMVDALFDLGLYEMMEDEVLTDWLKIS